MPENAIETVHLLVVSREPAVLRPLWSIGESNSWQLETAGSGWEAMERVQSGTLPDLLLLDLPRGDADSLHILRWFRRLRPELPIILMSYADDAGRRKEALRLGAQEFLLKPVEDEQLESAIRRHLFSRIEDGEIDFGSEDVEQLSDDAFFVGASPLMRKLRAQAELLAEANVPVLILGERGSGKDTAARLIHKLSVRSGLRFAKVNCGALSSDLLESELFGHEGTSPGGRRTKPGKFELCEKGTILLDEIVEMPAEVQAQLLEVLQNKRFFRPGSGAEVAVDVRILAATGCSMERAISEKRFREDLYYRLSAFTVLVPPLRQRKDELPLLLQHFMHHLVRHYSLAPRVFSEAALEACQAHSWPGNLRELESFVKRYLLVGDAELAFGGQDAGVEEWSESSTLMPGPRSHLGRAAGSQLQQPLSEPNSLKSLVQSVKLEAERNAIAAALEKTGWNRKAAARLLKVSYRTMLYKIEQYHMRASDEHSFLGEDGSEAMAGLKGNGRVS